MTTHFPLSPHAAAAGRWPLLRRALLSCCAALACMPRGDLADYSSGEGLAGAGGASAPPAGGAAGAGSGGAAGAPGQGSAGSSAAPPVADAGMPPSADAAAAPSADGGSSGAPSSPRVLATVPADGAAGVTRDTTLSIAFSAAMDRASVEAAFSLENLNQVAPEFRWDADGMLLNVVLDAPLSYATGNDPALVAPLPYAFRISSAARDADGNALPDTRVSFTTLRELSLRVDAQPDPALTGNWRSDGVYGTDSCAQAGTNMCIGDSSFGPNASYRGFASFDLSALPAGTVQIQSAAFGLQVASVLGTPSASLGRLVLEHVRYAAIGPEPFAASSLEQLASVATVQAGSTPSFDALSAVRDDWQGALPSQYRLRFEVASDADGATDLLFATRASASLSIIYLLP